MLKLIKCFIVGFVASVLLLVFGSLLHAAVLNAAEKEAEFDRARWIDEQQGTEMLLEADERERLRKEYEWAQKSQ